jgi:hypothetical protein
MFERGSVDPLAFILGQALNPRWFTSLHKRVVSSKLSSHLEDRSRKEDLKSYSSDAKMAQQACIACTGKRV